MTSYVAIANLAASKLGEDDQIRSPGDDTHVARSIAAVWDQERRAALRDHSWNFAMRRAELAAEAIAVPFGWAYSFPLPADNLRLIEVMNCRSSADYQIEGRAILADQAGPLRIRYIADITEPALWDDLFVEAFACRIGFQIADRITGDRGRKSDLWASYRDALAQAKRVDARENPPIANEATLWERARFGGADWGCRVDRNGLVWP